MLSMNSFVSAAFDNHDAGDERRTCKKKAVMQEHGAGDLAILEKGSSLQAYDEPQPPGINGSRCFRHRVTRHL